MIKNFNPKPTGGYTVPNNTDDLIDTLWCFTEGMDVKQFEQFLYHQPDLEALLPSDLYLELITFNYKHFVDPDKPNPDIHTLMTHLQNWLGDHHPPECPCSAWGISSEFLTFEPLPGDFYNKWRKQDTDYTIDKLLADQFILIEPHVYQCKTCQRSWQHQYLKVKNYDEKDICVMNRVA